MKFAVAVLLALAATAQAQTATLSLGLNSELGSVSGSPAFAVDLTIGTTAPISGFQVDFDTDGSNNVLPDEVIAGPVVSSAGYSIVFGSSAAVAFAFDLTEISDSESPFVGLTFLFSNPSSVAGSQFCIDEDGDGTVVSNAAAESYALSFLTPPCAPLPDVIFSFSTSGLTLTVDALNLTPIGGVQFFFTGPDGFAIDSASNGNLASAGGFNNPSSGVDGVLSFSLSGSSIATQTESDSLLLITFNLPGDYCFDLSKVVASDSLGLELSFAFAGGITCFTLEELDCPTAGTGDVNFDGVVNIQDVVSISNELLGLGEGFDSCQTLSADTVPDGTLNIADVVALIAFVLGTASPIP